MFDYLAIPLFAGYAIVLMHYLGRQVRHATCNLYLWVIFGGIIFCAATTYVFWCALILQLELLDGAWVLMFGALLFASVLSGMFHTEREAGSQSIFWARAARMRRTYRNLIGATHG